MKFKKALKAMKEGKTVSRHIYDCYTAKLSSNRVRAWSTIEWHYNGELDPKSQCDLNDYEAKDWYIVEEGCGDNVPANEEA